MARNGLRMFADYVLNGLTSSTAADKSSGKHGEMALRGRDTYWILCMSNIVVMDYLIILWPHTLILIYNVILTCD